MQRAVLQTAAAVFALFSICSICRFCRLLLQPTVLWSEGGGEIGGGVEGKKGNGIDQRERERAGKRKGGSLERVKGKT